MSDRNEITPKELKWSLTLYLFGWALVLLAGIAMLLWKLVETPDKISNNQLIVLIIATITCLSHIIYLLIVTKTFIFSVPNHLLRSESFIIPSLMTLAYGAILLDAFNKSIRYKFLFKGLGHRYSLDIHLLSLVIFIFVYAIWLFIDFRKQRTKKNKIWIAIDLCMIVLILLDIWISPIIETALYGISFKDLGIFTCSLLYIGFEWSIISDDGKRYVNIYTNYLKNCHLPPNKNIHGLDMYAHPSVELLKDKQTVNVFDFGCGDSSRLLWILSKVFKSLPDKKLNIVRYDLVSDWENHKIENLSYPIKEKVSECKFTHNFHEAERLIPNIDIIHASHALYDSKAVLDFVKLLSYAKPNTLIVIRGYDVSIFREISLIMSLMRPTINVSHLWDIEFCNYITNQAKLTPWPNQNSYRLEIPQYLKKDISTVQNLEQFFQILYGNGWTEKASYMYSTILSQIKTDRLPNSDKILFFIKQG